MLVRAFQQESKNIPRISSIAVLSAFERKTDRKSRSSQADDRIDGAEEKCFVYFRRLVNYVFTEITNSTTMRMSYEDLLMLGGYLS